MTASAPANAADPRPRLTDDGRLAGGRCTACGYAIASKARRCPVCRAHAVEAEAFGPAGVVWSATTVHVDVGGRRAPFGLAYVDLDGGPRVLAHADPAPAVGSRVTLRGITPDGDLVVQEDA